jgi:aminopeptidase N
MSVALLAGSCSKICCCARRVCWYYNATSLSERLTTLRGLEGTPAYNRTLSHFYATYGSKPMAMYKWFRAQAGSDQPGNTENVRALMRHPAFDARDGWTCSAVLSGFADSVPNFHAADGSGYRFLADAILEVGKKWHNTE